MDQDAEDYLLQSFLNRERGKATGDRTHEEEREDGQGEVHITKATRHTERVTHSVREKQRENAETLQGSHTKPKEPKAELKSPEAKDRGTGKPKRQKPCNSHHPTAPTKMLARGEENEEEKEKNPCSGQGSRGEPCPLTGDFRVSLLRGRPGGW